MEDQKLPVRTFIPTKVGEARQNWYKTKKKPELDKLDANIKAPESFLIADIRAFVSDVSKLIAKNSNLGVYFGTQTDGKPDLVLLFASVKKWSNLPGEYYLLNAKGRLEVIAVEKAHALRNNYQNGIKPLLSRSTDDGHTETEYVYFEKDIITEIVDEIDYQARQGNINGLKIQMVSYADKKTEGGFLKTLTPKYIQRLAILFTYVKDGRDTTFEEIDRERFRLTVAAQEGPLVSGLDTGDPIPPYPLAGPEKK